MRFIRWKGVSAIGFAGVVVVSLLGSGCVTKRTVSTGGRTVEEKYVVKRPVKRFIKNVEFE